MVYNTKFLFMVWGFFFFYSVLCCVFHTVYSEMSGSVEVLKCCGGRQPSLQSSNKV